MKKIIIAVIILISFIGSVYPQKITEEDLSKFFPTKDAAFVLYDLKSNQYTRYNPQRCARQFLPASTFKIFNSLVGLETGVIKDENYVIKWDSTEYDIKSWNHDQTLQSAIKNSVVWYYRELARRVGLRRMQRYLDEVGYGNMSIGGGVDNFWLDGSLQISADEQIEFLKRLYFENLPFSKRSMDIVKKIITLEETKDYTLKGKTGLGELNSETYVAWFVGWVEKGKDVYFFAMNMNGTDAAKLINTRIDITKNILKHFGII